VRFPRLVGAAGDSKVGRHLLVGTPAISMWRRIRRVTTPGFPVAYKAKVAEKGASFLKLPVQQRQLNRAFLRHRRF
jgi:hypothetical protein